jgi:hypothetical protein
MLADDGVSVGGCCTHDCNQGRTCPDAPKPTRTLADWFVDAFMFCVISIAVMVMGRPTK